MNPPYSMLDKVVHKPPEDGASAILVVPDWPHRLWWRRLQGVVTTALFFPRGHRVFELSSRICGPVVGERGHILSQVLPWWPKSSGGEEWWFKR